jgi:BlaI family penicillinase repressor
MLNMKSPRFTLFGFRRPREVVCSALGKLESAVLEKIWQRGETSVREIQQAIDENIAYTTWMTTLDRLYRKGLLKRRKEGRAFLYSSSITEKEFELGVAEDVIDGLLGSESAEPILACFVDAVSELDRELLDELDRLVQDKRRKLGSKD